MTISVPPKKQNSIIKLAKSIPLPYLVLAAIATAVIELRLENQLMQSLITVAVGIAVGTAVVYSQADWKKTLARYTQKRGFLALFGVVGLLGFCSYFMAHAAPSYAIFLTHAETQLKAQLPALVDDADSKARITDFIGMIALIYRFFLLIGIIAAAVKIVMTIRDDGDIKEAAKLPAIALLVVAITDLASRMII